MDQLKISGITIILPSTSVENSRDFYIKNLGFELSPNGNVENNNLSINFVESKRNNTAGNNPVDLDECRVVLRYKSLSPIDHSKFDIVKDFEVPYGRFIYIRDNSGNLICLSE